MVDVMQLQPGQTIGDPACGTGGFLLAAHDYITEHYHPLDRDQKQFLRDHTFRGNEIVDNTARLCAMNLFLHGIGGTDINATPPIEVKDSLLQEPSEHLDMVLANPPFGRKSSITVIGEDGSVSSETDTISRDDFWATTANKQLNFLQHIRSLLKVGGVAAVVLPDNVLFEGRAGETIRRRLLHECNVQTLLRLPTGIFYAQGVKANVLFFERGPASKDPHTKELWVYDFRTNQNFTLKTRPRTRADLDDFVDAYRSGERSKRVDAENFKRWTYQQIAERPGFNLDIWADVKDESLTDPSSRPAPEVIAAQIVEDRPPPSRPSRPSWLRCRSPRPMERRMPTRSRLCWPTSSFRCGSRESAGDAARLIGVAEPDASQLVARCSAEQRLNRIETQSCLYPNERGQ